jgi:hypothetical protein
MTAILAASSPATAQPLSHRGFIEARGFWFPQDTPHDRQNIIVDVLAREELFVKPAPWLQFAAGLDVRANTGDQVADRMGPDISDRGLKRPRLSVRRLSATLTRGPVTIDAGKQFVRWGKTDIVTPTDRFAPRDFLNVVDSEFLAVRGVRGVIELSGHTLDAVWVPVFTPSRIPLLSTRWTVIPAGAPVAYVDERTLPRGSQAGIRWGRTGSEYEYSLSFFDGFNHLPNVTPDLKVGPTDDGVGPSFRSGATALHFPSLRMYGGDAAVPTRWFTLKGEAAYFTSSTVSADEYLLYVVQLERQTGEWLIIGGYAGEVVTTRRALATFLLRGPSPGPGATWGPESPTPRALDRGQTRSVLGRASYTIDPNRSVAIEAAVRENLKGVYAKAEYSQAHGQHWRTTVTTALLQGDADDFLGQYRRNSHALVGVRYSF